MAPSIPPEALEPLFILRVLSPSIVLLTTLSLLAARPPAPAPPSPSPITSVVVATRTHRRALIYALLSLTGLTFLLDGLAFVVTAVVRKDWPEFTGLDVNAVVGLAAFAGLGALGAWKEVRGVDVWALARFKVSVFGALALDVAQVVLLALAIPREYSYCFFWLRFFPVSDDATRRRGGLLLLRGRGWRVCKIGRAHV